MKFFVLLMVLIRFGVAEADWRRDLLTQEGIGMSRAELEKAKKGSREKKAWPEALGQLGSSSYPVRVRAQARLVAGGSDALTWLKTQKLPESPEVRIRVREVVRQLESPILGSRRRILDHAVRSLLAEIGKPADPATGGMFHEWFEVEAQPLGPAYRQFVHSTPEGMLGKVSDGVLQFAGDRPGNDDQRLILNSKVWPAAETFPDRFRISAKLGGSAGGAGAWHLGITVGRIRALYHPGYRSGAFRFEQVSGNTAMGSNQKMGFIPSTHELQQMVVRVRREPDGKVTLSVQVSQAESSVFETSATFEADEIGPLDQISLDRSGRTGGDACFDHLTVEFPDL